MARAERDACEAGDAEARQRVMDDINACDDRTQALALLTMYLFTGLHLCQDQIEEEKEKHVEELEDKSEQVGLKQNFVRFYTKEILFRR